MNQKRKPLVAALITIAILAAAAAGAWFFWLKDYLAAANATPVYVNPIASIIGLDTGTTPRYSGIVEPQQIYKVNKDESKKVAEILVEPGDAVSVGDVLFRYDTQDMQLALSQAEIDQQGIANMISTLQRQLTTAQSEKQNADKDEQAAYTIQIQELEVQIRQQQYESSKKKDEIDRLREAMSNTDVLCEVAGVVKEVNSESQIDYTGQRSAFISILSAGEYRVKGSVSELNYTSITQGQTVIVHSRLNDRDIWRGTVDSIDREASSDQNNNMFYYGPEAEKSSKYNFYVVLEDPEGLILGQHVYIEPDLGEAPKKDGLWLPAMYIAHDQNGSFVWVKNDKDRLAKQLVTLGEYDADNDTYQITSGVTRYDSIAYPAEDLKPGMPTTTDVSALDFGGQGGFDSFDPGPDVGSAPSIEEPIDENAPVPLFPVEDGEDVGVYDGADMDDYEDGAASGEEGGDE